MATFCPTFSHWRGNTGLGNWPNGQGFWKELPCGFLFPSPGDDGVAVVIHSLVPNSLQPHELQHVRLACPSLYPWVCSNTCPLSQWCHSTISFSVVPFSSHLQSFPASGSFSVLHIRWPKYWIFIFSISPSNEYSGLISFRIDWFDLFAVQGLSRVLSNTTV